MINTIHLDQPARKLRNWSPQDDADLNHFLSQHPPLTAKQISIKMRKSINTIHWKMGFLPGAITDDAKGSEGLNKLGDWELARKILGPKCRLDEKRQVYTVYQDGRYIPATVQEILALAGIKKPH